MAVGYDDRSNAFIVRNSWGEDWVNKISFVCTSTFLCNQ